MLLLLLVGALRFVAPSQLETDSTAGAQKLSVMSKHTAQPGHKNTHKDGGAHSAHTHKYTLRRAGSRADCSTLPHIARPPTGALTRCHTGPDSASHRSPTPSSHLKTTRMLIYFSRRNVIIWRHPLTLPWKTCSAVSHISADPERLQVFNSWNSAADTCWIRMTVLLCGAHLWYGVCLLWWCYGMFWQRPVPFSSLPG